MDGNQWSPEDFHKLSSFYKENEKILKSANKRTEKAKIKLISEFSSSALNKKYTVGEIQKKLDSEFQAWILEDVMSLIEFYQSHPFLWAPSHADYHKTEVRDDAIEQLQSQLIKKHSFAEIKSKWTNLVTVWHRKQATVPKRKTCEGFKRKSIDTIYEALDFLHEKGTSSKVATSPPSNEIFQEIEIIGCTSVYDENNCDSDAVNGSSSNCLSPTIVINDSSCASSTVNDQLRCDDNVWKPIPRGKKNKMDNSVDEQEEKARIRLRKTLENALSEKKQSANDVFCISVAMSLDKLNEISQEFAKIEIQKVLAEFLRRQVLNLPMPTFDVRDERRFELN